MPVGQGYQGSIWALERIRRYLRHIRSSQYGRAVELKDGYRASTKAKDVSFKDTFTSFYVEDNSGITLKLPTVPAAKAQPRCLPYMWHIQPSPSSRYLISSLR